jgi:gliding motility-associated-like protein
MRKLMSISKSIKVLVLINLFILTSGRLVALDQYRLCAGESLILSATSNARAFSWFRNGVPVPENQSTLLVNEAGLYTVIAVTDGGCGSEASEPVEILIDPIPQIRVRQPSPVCEPTGMINLIDQILDFDTSSYDYFITDGLGVSKRLDEVRELNESGAFYISVAFKGKECWSSPTRINVFVAEEFMEADFEMEIQGSRFSPEDGKVQAFVGEPINFIDLSVGEPVRWDWNFGDGNLSREEKPVHSFSEAGEYEVLLNVVNEAGCAAIISVIVEVTYDYRLEIPNAFTPKRDDGKNNYFRPYYRGIVQVEFSIFNTWGELIYVTKDLEMRGWDGTLNGVEVPNGNYVYKGEDKR